MARISLVEPLVEQALIDHPATRGDNFLLYVEVLKNFVDIKKPMEELFENHKALKIPALETITRCRRKLQEKNPSLRDEEASEIRNKEIDEYLEYSKE